MCVAIAYLMVIGYYLNMPRPRGENIKYLTLAIARFEQGVSPKEIPTTDKLQDYSGVSRENVLYFQKFAECLLPLGPSNGAPVYLDMPPESDASTAYLRMFYAGIECIKRECPLMNSCFLYTLSKNVKENLRLIPDDMKDFTYYFE